MQRSQLFLALILFANFNVIDASKQDEQPSEFKKPLTHLFKENLKKEERFNTMIQDNELIDFEHTTSNRLLTTLATTNAIVPIVYKLINLDCSHKSMCTVCLVTLGASIFACSLGVTLLTSQHNHQKNALSIKNLESTAQRIGISAQRLQEIEINCCDDSDDDNNDKDHTSGHADQLKKEILDAIKL